MSEKIAVVGGGAWGTALAENFSWGGHEVTLWSRDSAQIADMRTSGQNQRYLPGIKLSQSIGFESDFEIATEGAAIICLAIPAQHMRGVVEMLAPTLPKATILISCAKGIEQNTGLTMSALYKQIAPQHIAATLSGPSFAQDVASGLPTAVTIATDELARAMSLCKKLSNPRLRCYASDDLIGVEYGGALKNVLAIVAGMVHGKKLGASALAAITARGFAELQAIALALNAKPETLVGLSGLGDLILTCASEKSRNFAYGAAFARGEDLAHMKLAEGVSTASEAASIAKQKGVDAPLINAVTAILSGQFSIDEAIRQLMNRPVKSET